MSTSHCHHADWFPEFIVDLLLLHSHAGRIHPGSSSWADMGRPSECLQVPWFCREATSLEPLLYLFPSLQARLVHPDKNYGCANAGEAFKCLQTAYETLIDPVKRKDYEDELKGRDMAERLNKMAEDARNHSRGGHGSNPHSTQGVSRCSEVWNSALEISHCCAVIVIGLSASGPGSG